MLDSLFLTFIIATSMQRWERAGLSIVNSANRQCLAVTVTECNNFAICNKFLNQTGTLGTMLNVAMQPCVNGDLSQAWSLIPQPYQPVLPWTPLNVSAAKYLQPDPSISQQVALNDPQVCSMPLAPVASGLYLI